MPNHVINKITFRAPNRKTRGIIKSLFVKGNLDFNILIPTPPTIYHGRLGQEEENDFNDLTWYNWNIRNWGTKWNAYNSSCQTIDGVTEIIFDTAWSPPLPVIVAFANIYKIDFRNILN